MNIRIIKIKTVETESAGSLSFFEGEPDLGFDIKRIYYIYGAPDGTLRGAHAHKKLKQFIFCPYGKIKIILDDLYEKKEFILAEPNKGIAIYDCMWRDTVWLKEDSVLCVAASDYYNKEDYIRNYDEFKELMRKR